MENAIQELWLALFTTLAPAGAGAYAALALAAPVGRLDGEQLRKADRLSWIFLSVAAIGFVCAVFHLTAPQNGFNVLAGLGRSPLANEVVAGGLFVVAAAVYTVLAATGKLGRAARTGLGAAVAVLAVAFAVFTGLAYDIATVPAWNGPLSVAGVLGAFLIGGFSLAGTVFAFAGAGASEGGARLGGTVAAAAAVGAALAVAALLGQAAVAGAVSGSAVAGAAVVAEALPLIVAACLVLAAAAVLCALGLRRSGGVMLAALALACSIAGVFLARLAFYALRASVGL